MDNVSMLSEGEAAALFDDDATSTEDIQEELEKAKEKEKDEPVEELPIDPEDLFDSPEKVDGEDKQDEEDTTSDNKDGDSPANIYSSIASGLKEEGIFQDLEDVDTEQIKNVEDFAEFFKKQLKAQLDQEQRRISEALDAGVEVDEIRRYENSIKFLDSITETQLAAEDEEGETLRKRIIYQDYINNGASKEKAIKMTELSFKNGTDVDDAKEALAGNRKYFEENYNQLIEEGKKEAEKEKQAIRESAERIKKSILSTEEPISGLKVEKAVRQKAYEVITKPVFQDKETGEYYTELQKYQMEHREEFLHKLGVLYALTGGFKSLGGLVEGKIKKEVKKGLKDLERKINSSKITPEGSFDYATGKKDPESTWRLAID